MTIRDRRELRRGLGPVAWCALECLHELSADGGGSTTASVRVIAVELGIAKNTAHRALAALARAGLIEAVQTRDPGGRFRSGHYRLHLGALFAAPTPTARTGQQRKSLVAPEQLTFLPSG